MSKICLYFFDVSSVLSITFLKGFNGWQTVEKYLFLVRFSIKKFPRVYTGNKIHYLGDWTAMSNTHTTFTPYLSTLSSGFKPCESQARIDAYRQANPSWKTHLCWFSCGGRCVNQSLVDDNIVLRQRTDSLHSDSPNYPQQRGCARGRSMRHAVFGAERLKYPLKRKHWNPGGTETNGDLRGHDEWERISWDEALDLIASEITRIKTTYGSQSILCTGYEVRTLLDRMYYAPSLSAYGGCTYTWGQASQGAFPVVSNIMKGSFNLGRYDYSDRFAIRHADLVVMWGQNPSWSMLGNVTYDYLQAKRSGARFIFVDPFCNPSMQPLADEWIPVRPGTDTALLLAIAHHLIEHDLYDHDIVEHCCVGFDADHMSPYALEGQQNFKDYVLGVYDDIPKTPHWASQICGTPVESIIHLARAMAQANALTLRASQAPARTENGGAFVQAFYTVGWMCGAIGKPGAETSAGAGGYVGFGGDELVKAGNLPDVWPVNPLCEPPRGGGLLGQGKYDPEKYYGIAMPEMWDAILSGEYTDFSHGLQPIDIRMIYKIGEGGRLNQNPNYTKGVKAFQSVEFVVTSDIWMTSDCKYSDIVLPSTTFWETPGIVQPKTNREFILCSSQITSPLFECREDFQTEADLACRWGIDPDVVNPKSIEEITFTKLYGAQLRNPETQALEPLITFTQQDLDQFGSFAAHHAPQQGSIPYETFAKTGVYQVERYADDRFMHYCYKDFINNPEDNPLPTESGKLEISSAKLVSTYQKYGLSHIAEVAHYLPTKHGIESTYKDFTAHIKGDYPFQTISLHHPARAHQAYDSVEQLRKLFPSMVIINELDAAENNITENDIVLIESPFGKITRQARITKLIMPGVLAVGEGSWSALDEKGIDQAGNSNTLQGSALQGEGECTWNSNIARITVWKEELQ